jgi:putative transposase
MSNLRRYELYGRPVFITCVTYDRKPILGNNAFLLHKAFLKVETEYNIEIIAYVIMSDHFHLLIDLKDKNISFILKSIKQSFSMNYRKLNNISGVRVWQNRFWDHIVRNQNDFNNHMNYIHYNPVKHGVSISPFDFKFSSIHNYKEYYPKDWGVRKQLIFQGNFGE